jgi:serine/threonine-protein kinase TTK/MPS1
MSRLPRGVPELPSSFIDNKENNNNNIHSTNKNQQHDEADTKSVREKKKTNASSLPQGLRVRLESATSTRENLSCNKELMPLEIAGKTHGTTKTSTANKTATTTTMGASKGLVVRSGESMDSLFCLSQSTASEHRRLCIEIAYKSSGTDAEAWRTALTVACDAALEHSGGKIPIDSSKFDLVRLHKRAMIKLNEAKNEGEMISEKVTFGIQMSHARAYKLTGQRQLAKQHYKDMMLLHGGVAPHSLYLSLAASEEEDGDIVFAKKTLEQCMVRLGVSDSSLDIEAKLQELDQKALSLSSMATSLDDKEKEELLAPRNSFKKKTMFVIPPLPSGTANFLQRDNKDHAVKPTLDAANTPSMHRKTQAQSAVKSTEPSRGILTPLGRETHFSHSSAAAHSTPARAPRAALAAASTSKKRVAIGAQHAASEKEQTKAADETRRARPALKPQGSHTVSAAREKKRAVMFAPSVKIGLSDAASGLGTSTSRFTSSRRTPMIRKRNLGGAPQRIGHHDSGRHDSENDDDTDIHMNTAEDNENPSSSDSNDTNIRNDKKAGKPVKMDLSYMLDWDPEKHFQKMKGGLDSTAEAETEDSEKIKANNGETKKNKHKSSPKIHAPEHEMLPKSYKTPSREAETVKRIIESSEHPDQKRTRNEPSPTTPSTDLTLNPDFVPLASVNNMISVNGKQYAKLGVIGMGGSCKVYRALSKNCQVLAIKKVKLAGKDQAQIDLFANEINLLKSLTGNPAIIQMYDSEVDLKRRAIFVVMEVGEVDLNYVLQQQSNMANEYGNCASKRSSLDINFVRLTWQQMLKAVHFIHQARIIHGDLKPANFLFVRGALKLIDFGIAKAMQNNDTTNIYRDGHIGTLNYMSPEAIVGTTDDDGGMKMKLGRVSACKIKRFYKARCFFCSIYLNRAMP